MNNKSIGQQEKRERKGKLQNMKKTQRILWYFPAVFFMAVIFWFSAQPAAESSAESSRVVELILHWIESIRGSAFSAGEFSFWAERIHTPIRKLAHMTEYALLAWTVLIPTLNWNREKLWVTDGMAGNSPDRKVISRICFASILAVMAYAGTDEFHQLFVEGRSGKVTDVLIDTCGAALGILFFLLLWKIIFMVRQKRQKKERMG